ncbi:hypothetical protein [Devosia sp. SL43]|uniref:hypothetical protein n=1 Tax=Devosia sp. SL43 TaxID=2806348 RepID=UPI001F3C01EF|nr:hypothetical protein [Devosia sp. SL43]UJW87959.1 hypothetical protein IM737_20610 [Devosia sp. SL43]
MSDRSLKLPVRKHRSLLLPRLPRPWLLRLKHRFQRRHFLRSGICRGLPRKPGEPLVLALPALGGGFHLKLDFLEAKRPDQIGL